MLLTIRDLAKRWRISTRTIERKRSLGLIPWVNLAKGGSRACVRFRLEDVLAYEREAIHGSSVVAENRECGA